MMIDSSTFQAHVTMEKKIIKIFACVTYCDCSSSVVVISLLTFLILHVMIFHIHNLEIVNMMMGLYLETTYH